MDFPIYLGKRLKKRRLDIGLTLQELAERSGLTASFISKLERGVATASLKTLARLSEILDVQVMYFLAEENPTKRLLRADQRRRMKLQDGEASYELLTPDLSGTFETLLIHVEPHSQNAVRRLRADTEELIYVLDGTLLVELDDEVFILYPGDSLHILNHDNLKRIVCKGERTVTYLIVISPPVL